MPTFKIQRHTLSLHAGVLTNEALQKRLAMGIKTLERHCASTTIRIVNGTIRADPQSLRGTNPAPAMDSLH